MKEDFNQLTTLKQYCAEHRRIYRCAQRLLKREALNTLLWSRGIPTPLPQRRLLRVLIDRRYLQLSHLAHCIKVCNQQRQRHLEAAKSGNLYESALLSHLMQLCERNGHSNLIHQARQLLKNQSSSAR